MSRLTLFRLKNQMFFFNLVGISMGVLTFFILSYRSISPPTPEIERLTFRIALFFEPLFFMFILAATLIFEQPIRHCLDHMYRNEAVPHELAAKARQRLLNEPFFLITLDLLLWLCAAIVYPISFYTYKAGEMIIGRALIQNLLIGLGTMTAAFFILEYVLQKMAPYFFPNGGLYVTPKTLRVLIRTRLAALIFACNLIPFLALIAIVRGSSRANLDPSVLIELLRPALLANAILGIGVGIGLAILVSGNITRPLKEIIRVLKRVRDGDLDNRVRVTSNDEIGYAGDVINEMTDGLKERNRMRRSLELAKEVQQNFLPKADPTVAGLDIAGKSIYCERTGGDYYDYLHLGNRQTGKIGIVVGDVSGHGISAALLMASARSSLRQRALLSGNIAQIVSDVNRQLTSDVEESGRFMTLFCSEIDVRRQRIRWVRAGHEPAIVYDPANKTFEELKGSGMALGVDESWQYEEKQKRGLARGQIILFGTDGIWETHNPAGQLFGKASLFDIIRKHAARSAEEIVVAIVDALDQFRQGVVPEDDVTLVVVKVVT
ncbi:MAG: SpoIIE family protein phosphatase [Deltaproteobacteria bacterium]|nr:SpoIIE family protein phosphatase [Deltaproteobacteria bacterium]